MNGPRAERRRRPALIGAGCALLVGVAILLCCLTGDASLNGAAAESKGIRFVTLPPAEIAGRVNDKWVPIERSKLDKLITDAKRSTTEPGAVQVRRASYSATFDGTQLHDGMLELDIHRTASIGRWLDLGGCNLAISKLTSKTGNAIWGTTSAGHLIAEVASDWKRLSGTWTMPGNRQEQLTRFDLKLIPAASATLRIRAPAHWRIDATAGEVAKRAEPSQPGWNGWVIDVSGRQSVSLLAWPQLAATPASPRVLVDDSELTYKVRESSLQVRFRTKLMVLNSPVRSVRFRVPRSVNVYQVDYADRTPLNFDKRRSGNDEIVIVHLPDELFGESRPMTVHGIASTETGKLWNLPAVTMPGAVYSSGVVHLQIDRPLRMGRLSTTGLRQSVPLEVTPALEKISFRQDRADARLGVVVGRLVPRLQCRAVSLLDAQAARCTLAETLTCTATQGPVFSVRLQAAPGWNITRISAPDGDGNDRPLNFTETRGKNRVRVLTVTLARALNTGESIPLKIGGHSLSAANRRRVRIPVVIPVDAARMNSTIVFKHASIFRPTLQDGATYRSLSRAAAELLLRPGFGPAFPAEPLPMVLQSDIRVPRGMVELHRRGEVFDAKAWTIWEMEQRVLRERFSVSIATGGHLPRHAFVFLSQSGPDVTWHLADRPDRALPSRRVKPAEWPSRQLPPAGELWRIELPQNRAGDMRLLAERTRRMTRETRPTICYVPQSRRFDGVVELRDESERSVQTRSLFPVRDMPRFLPHRPREAPRQLAASRFWRYQTADAELLLESPGPVAETTPAAISSFDLWTVISSVAGSRDRHRAVYRIAHQAEAGHVEWTIPPEIHIDRVTLNGRPVTMSNTGRRLRVDPLAAGRDHVIAVEYSTNSAETGWWAKRSIPLPVTIQNLPAMRWHVALPDHYRPIPGDTTSVVLPANLPADWSVRFFGPLARSTHDSTEPGETAADPVRISGGGFTIPTGWTVYHTTLPRIPNEIRVAVTNRDAARRWAWVGLLLCLIVGWGLRRWQFAARARFGAWWLSTMLAIAIIVPDLYAEFAGACVVGSLVAALTPRRLIRKETVSEASLLGIPMGSTASFPRVASSGVVVLLAVAVLFTRPGTASQLKIPPAEGETRPPAIDKQTVLVPKRDIKASGAGIVYAHRTLLDALRKSAAVNDTQTAYLIQRARYDLKTVDADSANLSARFDVVRRSNKSPTTVRLPLKHAHLCGRNACRVNGREQLVRRDTDGDAFLVDLPVTTVSATYRIELCLRVALKDAAGDRIASVGIPAVPASRLFVESTFARHRFDPSLLSNVSDDDVWFSRRISGDVGRRSRLELRWHSPDSTAAPRAPIQADVHGLIEISPALSVYRYHVRYNAVSRPVGQIRWRIPKNWSVLAINLAGRPSTGTTLRFREQADGNSHRRVFVSLPSPRTKPFALTAEFVVPHPGGPQTTRVDLPRLHAEAAVNRARGSTFTETSHAVGLVVPAEFELRLSQPRAVAMKPIPEKDQVVFRDLFPGIRGPQFAYQLAQPSSLRARLAPVVPTRGVESRQSITFGRERLRLRYDANVAITSAAAFEHQLIVPPQLEIESVNVVESGAPRLERWIRTGNKLTIYLSEKSLGLQAVSLSGGMAIPRTQRVRLPVIRFANATVKTSRLDLFRESTVAIGLLDSGDAQPLDGVRPLTNSGGWFVAAYNGGAGKPPTVRVAPRIDTLRIDRLTRIGRPLPSGEWTLQCTLRLQDDLPYSGIVLTIPDGLHAELIDAQQNWRIEQRPRVDGGANWLLRANRQSSPKFLEISAIATGAGDAAWTLPTPGIEAATLVSDSLAMPAAKPSERLISTATPTSPAERPEWIAARVDRRTTLLRNNGQDWRFEGRRERAAGGRREIPFVESWIWNLEDQPVRGRTELYVKPAGNEPLTIRIPASLRLDSIRLDGRALNVQPTNAGLISVPIGAAALQHLRIDWRQRRHRRLPALAFQQFDLPQPVGIEPVRALVRMATSGTRRSSGFDGAKPMPAVEFQIDRIRRLTAIARDGGNTNDGAVRAYHAARVAFKQLDAANPPVELAEARRDLHTLSASMPSEPPEADPRFPTAAPHLIWHGELESNNGAGGFRFRAVDRWLARGVIAMLLFVIVLPFAALLFRLELSDVLARWEPVSWGALGTVWCLFLTFWFVGAAFLLIAAVKATTRLIDSRRRRVIRVYDQVG